MCGPSNTEKSLSSGSANFYNTLKSSYAQNFGAQSAILSNLNTALEPIISGGPNQSGFSAEQKAAMTSSAINNAATANRNAQVIAGSNVGGNTGVTTGGQKQLQAQIATGVGSNLATNENQINLEDAELGRQNFFNAETALAGVGAQYNPTGYAGQATSAGNQAFGEASTINQEKNQEFADIGGLAAGLGGSFLGSNFAGNLAGGKLFGPGGAFG